MRTRLRALCTGLLAVIVASPASAQEARCGEFRGQGGSYLSPNIRNAVPGVGGYFWDNECNFVVLLKDMAFADSARSCYASLVPTGERFLGKSCIAEPRVRALPAEFTHQEMAQATRRLLDLLHAADAGARLSINDSTQAFSVLVKNERAQTDAEAAIRGESSLAPFTISVGLKPPEAREFDGPGNPPASAYAAAVWHLKTVFEVRYNEMAESPDRWMRLQCVTFSKVPENLQQVDLAPLGFWFRDCGRQQTIWFGRVRAFNSGAFGIQAILAGYCGEVKVEPRPPGWTAHYWVGECGVGGYPYPLDKRSDGREAQVYDQVVRLELLSSDSSDVLAQGPPADALSDSRVVEMDGARFVSTVDSAYYLIRSTPAGSELWGRRETPPSGLDSIAFKINRPFHFVTGAMHYVYVLDVPAGTVVAFDSVGNRVASRTLPRVVADSLRAGIGFSPRSGGYTLSLPVSSFQEEDGRLILRARRFAMIDPLTLGVTVIGLPWVPPGWPQMSVRGDTLITVSRFGRRHTYRMVPVPANVPLMPNAGLPRP